MNKNVFDENLAYFAIKYSLASIKAIMNRTIPPNKDLYIIVGNIHGDILATKSLGHPSEWDFWYNKIAKKQFEMTVSHKQPSRFILEKTPELIDGIQDEVLYYGSWIEGEIIVACSGVEPNWNEAFSKIVTTMASAQIKAEMVESK